MEHIERWKKISDIDYYMLFIKKWIPFNAWYVTIHGKDKSDRDCINLIQKESKLRDRVIALLESESHEALAFKKNIAGLYTQLDNNPFPDIAKRITFKKIDLGSNSTNPRKEGNYKDNLIKIERYVKDNLAGKPNKSVETTVVNKDETTIFNKVQPKFNPDELKEDPKFSNINTNLRKKIIEMYNEVNPRRVVDLTTPKSKNAITLDKGCYFIDNKEDIYCAIIEILYLMRCKIFHGEMIPDENNKDIYKYGYLILSTLVTKIL